MNANKFDISIIVPIYNGEKYINRCIDSIVLAAMGYDIEIILVDDGSADRSAHIIQKYSDQLSWVKVIHQKNKGPSAARNTGLEAAQGKYIGFVDCDDSISTDYFSTLLVVCKNNPDIIVFGYEKILLNGKHYISKPKSRIHNNEAEDLLCNVNQDRELFWLPSTKLFKKELISSIRFDEAIRLGEDTIFNLHAVINAKNIVRINANLYAHYEICGSLSSNEYKPNLLENMEKHFSSRLAINKKTNRGLDDKTWSDIYHYYIFHILPWLFSNSMHLSNEQQLKELALIRDSNFINKCYTQKHIFSRKPKMVIMQALFRVRLFKLLQKYLMIIFIVEK